MLTCSLKDSEPRRSDAAVTTSNPGPGKSRPRPRVFFLRLMKPWPPNTNCDEMLPNRSVHVDRASTVNSRLFRVPMSRRPSSRRFVKPSTSFANGRKSKLFWLVTSIPNVTSTFNVCEA